MYKVFIKVSLLLLAVFLAVPFVYFKDTEVVKVTHLKGMEYSSNIQLNGTIEADNSIKIALSYPSYIKECLVTENSYVNKGQLLFVLDTEKMRNAVKNYSFTGVENAINLQDSYSYLNISDKIYASESGYIKQLSVSEGDFVSTDSSLCVIENNNDLYVKISLNQSEYPQLSVGDKIVFSPLTAPNKKYYAVFEDKTAKVRKETGISGNNTYIDVYAKIENSDDNLVQGLQVCAELIKEENNYLKALPYEYVNQDEKGEYVNVFDKGNIDKVYIQTGIETEDSVEIITEFSKDTMFAANDYNNKGKTVLEIED